MIRVDVYALVLPREEVRRVDRPGRGAVDGIEGVPQAEVRELQQARGRDDALHAATLHAGTRRVRMERFMKSCYTKRLTDVKSACSMPSYPGTCVKVKGFCHCSSHLDHES